MRICLYAGAGSGKTTTCHGLSHALKKKGHNIELVQEYIKGWAYMGRTPKSFDQVFLFAQQLHAEDFLFQNGVEHVVTDSPVILSAFYGRKYGFAAWETFLELGDSFERKHPSVNIFLSREGIPYRPHGRFETEAGAAEADEEMKIFLATVAKVPYVTLRTVDFDAIVRHAEAALAGNQKEPALAN